MIRDVASRCDTHIIRGQKLGTKLSEELLQLGAFLRLRLVLLVDLDQFCQFILDLRSECAPLFVLLLYLQLIYVIGNIIHLGIEFRLAEPIHVLRVEKFHHLLVLALSENVIIFIVERIHLVDKLNFLLLLVRLLFVHAEINESHRNRSIDGAG